MPGTTATFPCRVKYLSDGDPFSYSGQYPEPPRPPVHLFFLDRPLGEQLPAIHKMLAAPQKVGDAGGGATRAPLRLCGGGGGGGGGLGVEEEEVVVEEEEDW